MNILLIHFLLVTGDTKTLFIVFAIFFVLAIIWAFISYINSFRCSRCRSFFTTKMTEKEYLYSNETYDRIPTSKTEYDPISGNPIEIKWQRPVIIITDHYNKHYKCKKCGYQWTQTSKKKYQKDL
ncbi:hypothetical protein [Dyadobacter sp. BHUBP1]|uniref:hypothetical protein n=1 Tax=Dyadobacter sp. BHUBP1 TaxID=3424178 RepID=UPI003D336FC5